MSERLTTDQVLHRIRAWLEDYGKPSNWAEHIVMQWSRANDRQTILADWICSQEGCLDDPNGDCEYLGDHEQDAAECIEHVFGQEAGS